MATAAKLCPVGDTIFVLRNIIVKGFSLAAAAATSTIEVFEGILGVANTAAVSNSAAGTNYEVGDLLTVASPAEGGTDLIIEVLTVDTGGEILTFSVSQEGTGFVDDTGLAATGGAGSGAQFDVDVTDDVRSIGKLSCVANTSESQGACIDTTKGVSVRVTGASAQGYLYYE